MQIKMILARFTKILRDAHFSAAALESRIILAHACKTSQEKLLLKLEDNIDSEQQELASKFLEMRLQHTPIAYITGYKEFYDHNFMVTPDVLIPRSDTELLVDVIVERYHKHNNISILELGVGSGCIIITLMNLLKVAGAVAVDKSLDALEVARCNVRNILGDNAHLELCHSDWFAQVPSEQYDIILCNPPYICHSEQQEMAQETLLHEPHMALFSEDDGLAEYRRIAQGAGGVLADGGRIFLEVGWQQASAVKQIFVDAGYKNSKIYRDLSDIERVVEIWR